MNRRPVGWTAGLACALLTVGQVSAAAAQESSDRGPTPLFYAVDAAVLWDVPHSFSESVCGADRGAALGGRIGWQPTRALGFAASAALNVIRPQECSNGFICFPPDDTGTYTCRFRDYDDRISGNEFLSTDVRAILEPLVIARSLGLRATGGVGWLWGKNIPVALLGLGVSLYPEASRLRVVIDVERWWFDVPFTAVTREYEASEVVSETREDSSVSASPFRVRVGLEWPR